jgi:hypothetical protein
MATYCDDCGLWLTGPLAGTIDPQLKEDQDSECVGEISNELKKEVDKSLKEMIADGKVRKVRKGKKTFYELALIKDSRVVVRKEIPVPHAELRWGEDNGKVASLHTGRYIVDRIENGKVLLADADWDLDGSITFHSTKHGHRVPLAKLNANRPLFEVLPAIKEIPAEALDTSWTSGEGK